MDLLRFSLSSFSASILFAIPVTWISRLNPESHSQLTAVGIGMISHCFFYFIFGFFFLGGVWFMIECFLPSTSYLYFWFLFSNMVSYLTALLSHVFSTLSVALRGPTLSPTIRLGVMRRLPHMQNIPRFLRRRLQRQLYFPT